MDIRRSGDQFVAAEMSHQQGALMRQLFQVLSSVHDIDELFQWLADALVQRFNIQLLLFWTNHSNPTGQLVAQLRATARQDPSLPDQLFLNDPMQRIAQKLISERVAYQPQPIETLLSQYQATVFNRYTLPYWCACFTSRNAFLPPRADRLSRRERPAPFAMTTLLFLRQIPQVNIVSTINTILEEAIIHAAKQGLLLSVNDSYSSFSSLPHTPLPQDNLSPFQSFTPPPQSFPPKLGPPKPKEAFTLSQLIPKRKQDQKDLLVNNPFDRPAVISDKNARRLHTQINGQANVEDLSTITGLNMQEIGVALRLLWDQHKIEVYDPKKNPVNLADFLKKF
jgi:hypothetical protein